MRKRRLTIGCLKDPKNTEYVSRELRRLQPNMIIIQSGSTDMFPPKRDDNEPK